VDLAVLPENIDQENRNEITVPLLGKVKGETDARQHLLHSVAVTSSNIPIKLRYQIMPRVHQGYGRVQVPAICCRKGFQLTLRVLNLKLWEA
jgi:hypothetical protein